MGSSWEGAFHVKPVIGKSAGGLQKKKKKTTSKGVHKSANCWIVDKSFKLHKSYEASAFPNLQLAVLDKYGPADNGQLSVQGSRWIVHEPILQNVGDKTN